jgi:hypothetical protein
MEDRLVLLIVRLWCLVRRHNVWRHTVLMNRIWPNPITPSSDIDKFMWRKIFDHNPLFAVACNKLTAKAYALKACPDIKTAEVLWTGQDATLIPDAMLAGDVVVKANNACGRNIMIRNGQIDREALRERTRKWQRRPYGIGKGEWAYQASTPCLFVERMLFDHGEPVESEYKFHVSEGRISSIFVKRVRENGEVHKFHLEGDGTVFVAPSDRQGKPVPFDPPASFAQMLSAAERLGAPFDYMRCDLYEVDGEVYFSELTVYPQSGRATSSLHARKLRNGAWDLRKSWFLTNPQPGWRGRYAAALHRWLDRKAASPELSDAAG